jgi:MFS family permease
VGNIGFVFGATLVGALTTRFGVGRTFAWSSFASATAMVLMACAGSGWWALILLAGRFAGAVATPIFNVAALSLRQARVDPSIMGRVNGTFQFLEWGALPIGSLVGGLLGALLGPRPALMAAALCGVASAVWIATSPARRLTSLGSPSTPDGEVAGPRPTDPAAGDGFRDPDAETEPSLRPPLVA